MGKHLAPKQKHELNFIKKKPTRTSGQKPAAHASKERKAASAAEKSAKALLRLPSMGRFPWLFPALSALLLLVICFLPLEGWMIPAAYAIPALLALTEQAADAYDAVLAGQYLNGKLITCVSAALLFLCAAYTEAVLLLLLSWLLSLLEKRLTAQSRAEQDKIAEILPESAVLVTEEGIERVDPASVQPGDILLVPAGERIPLDGVITEGITTIDTLSVSGQRSPWAVNVGYKVYSGCRNLTSDIKIRVSRPYEQSTAVKLVRVAKSATDFPSEQESGAGRILKYYTPAVLALSLIVGVVIPIFRGEWMLHLRRAAVMLIAARAATDCFSIPLLYRRALTRASDMGAFSKGEDCLESIARAETVIFDKTGTITEGRYTVTDVCPVKMSERQLLTIAATAEGFCRHPIAYSIREAAGKIDDRVLKAIKLREYPGRGISSLMGSHQVYVGNAALLEEHGIKYNVPSRPGTAIHVSVDNRYCGYILVTDKVRRRAFDALETLRVNGVKKLVLLTGDVLSVARPIASRLNFDMLRAELKPEEKAKAVGYLMKNKGAQSAIAFVGEGENSGRIMSGADVGIAMGSLGSDTALACADVLIMDRDIFKIPRLLTVSRLTYRASWENLAAGAGMNLIILLFGALGIFSPLAAEILAFLTGAALLGNTLRIK